MKIASSTIGMESARSYQASNVTVRRFTIKEYQAGLTQNQNTLNTSVSDSQENAEEKSEQTTEQKNSLLEDWQNRYQVSTAKFNIRSSSDNTISDIRQMTIRYIFDLLFSSRRERWDKWMDESGMSQNQTVQTSNSVLSGSTNVYTANIKVFNYTQETFRMETENTSFSTVGTVRTADGRELHFNVNVGMSREFQEYYREESGFAFVQPKMCDPLVINLDTDAAELSDQKFFFDIDADGEEDEIAQLGSKSGYLALDKNGDGIINDGSELFGTKSGDGFADLAQYDNDGNGWIDENDEIWSKLKIWCKDENGEDVLYRLADKGVGAICLQKAATDFILQADDGAAKGAIRSTGIFLYENGNVGTLQHVDVAKYDREA